MVLPPRASPYAEGRDREVFAMRVKLSTVYDPPVSGNSTFEFDAIAQSCDSAVDAGACATYRRVVCSLARPKTRTRWRMAAVNVLSAL